MSVDVSKAASRARSSEILGVSHLVLSVDEMAEATGRFEEIGYREHGSNEVCPNPPEKAPFIDGPIAASVALKLLVVDKGLPAIELIREPRRSSRPAAFEPLLSTKPLAHSGDEAAGGHRGAIARSLSGAGDPATAALILHCPSWDETLPLWRALGFDEETIDEQTVHVVVPSLRRGNELNVYLVRDREESTACHLNDGGFVCLSLFCKDADRLRSELADAGHDVGECFDLDPFGSSLRIFFMRNRSGEIYEFLSVGRARRKPQC